MFAGRWLLPNRSRAEPTSDNLAAARDVLSGTSNRDIKRAYMAEDSPKTYGDNVSAVVNLYRAVAGSRAQASSSGLGPQSCPFSTDTVNIAFSQNQAIDGDIIDLAFDRTRLMSQILLRAVLVDDAAARTACLFGIVRGYTPATALVRLIPNSRQDAGVSVPLVNSIERVRTALACKGHWIEVSRSQEYDYRWSHAVRVTYQVCIDQIDASQVGRIAIFNLLFFLERGMPRLRNCLIQYEEATAFPSPISRVCASVA
jgi:hypothetical protein